MYFTDHKQRKGKEKGKERGAEGRGPQSERRFGEQGRKPSGRGIGLEKGAAARPGSAFNIGGEKRGEERSVRYPSSCWFLLALILDPSANSSMLLYSFMSSIAAEWSAGRCWRADRVAAAAAAERCMELDLKWRRKRSGR